MLQFMGSQRAGHDLVTKQPPSQNVAPWRIKYFKLMGAEKTAEAERSF